MNALRICRLGEVPRLNRLSVSGFECDLPDRHFIGQPGRFQANRLNAVLCCNGALDGLKGLLR